MDRLKTQFFTRNIKSISLNFVEKNANVMRDILISFISYLLIVEYFHLFSLLVLLQQKLK